MDTVSVYFPAIIKDLSLRRLGYAFGSRTYTAMMTFVSTYLLRRDTGQTLTEKAVELASLHEYDGRGEALFFRFKQHLEEDFFEFERAIRGTLFETDSGDLPDLEYLGEIFLPRMFPKDFVLTVKEFAKEHCCLPMLCLDNFEGDWSPILETFTVGHIFARLCMLSVLMPPSLHFYKMGRFAEMVPVVAFKLCYQLRYPLLMHASWRTFTDLEIREEMQEYNESICPTFAASGAYSEEGFVKFSDNALFYHDKLISLIIVKKPEHKYFEEPLSPISGVSTGRG